MPKQNFLRLPDMMTTKQTPPKAKQTSRPASTSSGKQANQTTRSEPFTFSEGKTFREYAEATHTPEELFTDPRFVTMRNDLIKVLNRTHGLDERTFDPEQIMQEYDWLIYARQLQELRIKANLRMAAMHNIKPQSFSEDDIEERIIESVRHMKKLDFMNTYYRRIQEAHDPTMAASDFTFAFFTRIAVQIDQNISKIAWSMQLGEVDQSALYMYLQTPVLEDIIYTDNEDISPQGFDLNINHHLKFPSFNLFGNTPKEPSVYQDALSNFAKDSSKNFTNLLDVAKDWIKRFRDQDDLGWIVQLTSDVSVFAMLWCWLVCYCCLKQFEYTVEAVKNAEPGRFNEDFMERDWEQDVLACKSRLKYWSRNLIIVLTINILWRLSNTSLFDKVTRQFISAIAGIRAYSNDESVPDEPVPIDEKLEETINSIEPIIPNSDFADHAPYAVGLMVTMCAAMTGLKTKAPLSNAILTLAKTNKNQRDNLGEMLINAFECIGKLLKQVCDDNVISRYFYVDKIDDERVGSILAKIKTFLATSYAGTDIIDPNRTNIYVDIKKEASAILKELDTKSYDFRMLSEGMKEIEKQSTILEAQTKSMSGDRVEPVGILLMGTPGTKKSVLMKRLAEVITYGTIPEIWKKDFEEAPHTFMFSKPIDQFWDTYDYRKWVLLCDDAFQKRDVAGAETSDAIDFISIINVAAMVLKMANVNQKNTTFLRTPFVIGTTNRDKQSIKNLDSVHEAEAVMRRFHLTVKVLVNPKYQGYVDALPKTKVFMDDYDSSKCIEGTTVPPDYWKLYLMKFDVKTRQYEDLGEITFEELVSLSIKTYNKHVSHYYVNKHDNLNTFKRLKQMDIFKLDKGVEASRWFSSHENDVDSFKTQLSEALKPQANEESEFTLDELDEIEEPTAPPEEEHIQMVSVDQVAAKLHEQGLPYELVRHLTESEMEDLKDPEIMKGFLEEYNCNKVNAFPYTKPALKGILSQHIIGSDYNNPSVRGAWIHGELLVRNHPIQASVFEEKDRADKYTEALSNFEYLMSSDYSCCFFMEIDTPWLEMCKRISRLDLFDKVNFCYQELYTSSDIKEKMLLVRYIDEPYKLVAVMEKLFEKRAKCNMDILTGVERRYNVFECNFDAKAIWNKVKLTLKKGVDFVKDNFITLTLMVGVGSAVIYGLYKLFDGLYDIISPQSKDTNTAGTRTKSKPKTRASVRKKNVFKLSNAQKSISRAQPQAEYTGDAARTLVKAIEYCSFGARSHISDIQTKVVKKYFYIMYLNEVCDDGVAVKRYGQCWNLSGNIFVNPFHYIFMLDYKRNQEKYMGATFTIMNYDKTNCYKITIEDYLNSFKTTTEAADCDIATFVLSNAQPSSTGLIKYLVTEEDYANITKSSRFNVDVVTTDLGKTKELKAIKLVTRNTNATSEDPVTIEAPWTEEQESSPHYYGVSRSCSYRGSFSKGDCGGLVFIKDGNYGNRCILGQHIAGTTKTGYSSVITREVANSLMELHGGILFEEEETPDIFEPETEIKCMANFHSTKKFKREHSIRTPDETNIIASHYQGKLPEPYHEIKHEPVFLAPFTDEEGKRVDPALKALEAYGSESPCLKDAVIKEAAKDFFDHLTRTTEEYKHPRRVLSVTEALNSYNSLNKVSSSTSSGYPMNVKSQTDYKTLYYESIRDENEEQEAYYTAWIEKRITEYINMILAGKRPFFVYSDFLKDEIRKIGKGARLISGSPWILLIMFRMFFGSFMDAFTEFNIEIGSAIGVNCFSSEWDVIGRKLSQFKTPHESEPQTGAGDIKGLDGSEEPFIHGEIVDGINEWYGYDDLSANRIRKALFCEIQNSRHIFSGNVYIEWFKSMPSGNPMTAIINTIYIHISFRACWIILELPISDFRKCVYLIVLGDDNVFHVHVLYRDKFNEITIAPAMEQIGLTYTTETKTKAVTPFRNLSEVEFLKRQWRKDPETNSFIAPLRLESIANMLNWTKSKSEKSPEQITVDNTLNALKELTLHGKDTYAKWSKVLINLKRKYYPGFSFPVAVSLEYSSLKQLVLKSEFCL